MVASWSKSLREILRRKAGSSRPDGRRDIVSLNRRTEVDKNSASPAHRPKRIIGLFPELLGVGGVQEAGRQTASALVEFARRRGRESLFLSLNDSPKDDRCCPFGTLEIPFRGFGRAKVQFILAAARAALDNAAIVLGGSPQLGPARGAHEETVAAIENRRDLTWHRGLATPTAYSTCRTSSSEPSTCSQPLHRAETERNTRHSD